MDTNMNFFSMYMFTMSCYFWQISSFMMSNMAHSQKNTIDTI